MTENSKNQNNNGKGDKPKKMMKKFEVMIPLNPKKIIIWAIIAFLVISFLFSLRGPVPSGEKTLTQVLSDIKNEKVDKIDVDGDNLYVTYKDNGGLYLSRKESQVSFTEVLKDAGIDQTKANYTIQDQSPARLFSNILEIFLPIVLTGIIFLWIFRQMRGAQDSIFSFGKSRARLFAKGKQNVTFSDVAGIDDAKKELEEVVDFLKHPKKYRALGARIPKGVLLVGPAGCGKTLLAKAVAGEAGVPFFSMAGSEFMEMLVGVGASRVRDLFSTAKRAAPSIIFIDEIDAIGRIRGGGLAGGHDEREQTLNQILVEMDGFTPNDYCIVVAATNRPELLDQALVRPGRFDRRIIVDMPDFDGRKAILAIHAKGKPFAPSIDWDKAAKRTVGFSGADLENMLNEAAIEAARKNKKSIDNSDIEEAATRVKLGPEKRRLQTDTDKKMTAYHEAGHAITTWAIPGMDKVHRVSIVSRGMALGYTLIPPRKDRLHETRGHLMDTISSLLGGRAAEEIQFNEFTTGASSDITQATQIARKMVIEYGMSVLGPVNFGPQMDTTEWGQSWYEPNQLSPDMAGKIDTQVKKIVDDSYVKTVQILKKNKKKLDLIAAKLIEQETLEGDDFDALMKKEESK